MHNKKSTIAATVFFMLIAALLIITAFANQAGADGKDKKDKKGESEAAEITVTIIGDSVALGAESTLVKYIPNCYVDAKVSRSIGAGYDLMMELQESGELREYVVIALGTNGHYDYANLFTKIIDDLDTGHRLILVTPFDGRTNNNAVVVNQTAEWLRELADKYEYLTIADWNELVKPQSNVLAGDKVHMKGQVSMVLYTNCVIGAINTAWAKPTK